MDHGLLCGPQDWLTDVFCILDTGDMLRLTTAAAGNGAKSLLANNSSMSIDASLTKETEVNKPVGLVPRGDTQSQTSGSWPASGLIRPHTQGGKRIQPASTPLDVNSSLLPAKAANYLVKLIKVPPRVPEARHAIAPREPCGVLVVL